MTPRELKKWRQQSMEMTQVEFADEIGVSRSTVNRWEGGLAPIPKMLTLLAQWRDSALRVPNEFGHL